METTISGNPVVLDYRPEHQQAFKALNEAWITRYFTIEPADRAMLDDPQGYILDRGGAILVAVIGETVVGVCGVLCAGAAGFELAKMAVAPEAQGRGIGTLLGRAAIEKARALGGRRLFLESNTILTAAMALYAKLGFTKVEAGPSPYCRCNIRMEMPL
jgi:GNAT superfamily N-acetyltransferase